VEQALVEHFIPLEEWQLALAISPHTYVEGALQVRSTLSLDTHNLSVNSTRRIWFVNSG